MDQSPDRGTGTANGPGAGSMAAHLSHPFTPRPGSASTRRGPSRCSGARHQTKRRARMGKTRIGIACIALVVAVTTSLGACANTPKQRVVVPHHPPPAKAIQRPPRPSPKHAWVPGHWRWRHGDWVWVKGRYVTRPHPRAHWVPGHWKRRPGGWVWIEGHWKHH